MATETLVMLSSLGGALAILLIQQIIKLFGSGYLKKKGENLATKEDISEITHQIETVKSMFDLQTENMKSFSQEQKLELLGFYDSSTEFRYEFLSVNFGNFPPDQGESLYEYQQKFHIKVTEILKGYQRLVVYLPPDTKLLSLAHGLVQLALQADKVMKSNFYQIKKLVSVNQSLIQPLKGMKRPMNTVKRLSNQIELTKNFGPK
ncbi:hypothetical protein VHTUMSATKI_12640 [Vibrio harveyi]|uniref:hypothetical protein n=1 Tax=Vibrio harveyi TaxID=669 RepID=UPI0036F2ACAE